LVKSNQNSEQLNPTKMGIESDSDYSHGKKKERRIPSSQLLARRGLIHFIRPRRRDEQDEEEEGARRAP
jgi:HJR/Mrr/RecB family endonuclease